MIRPVLCPLLIEDIAKYLPHRPPMLMIDKVISFDEVKICAEKKLTGAEFFFQGHFPENPIMPGVMIVEAIGQTGALIALLNEHFDGDEHILAFAGLERAKFKKMVRPGDRLCINVEIVKQRRNLYKFVGEARVGDSVVTQLNFSAAMTPKSSV